MKTTTLKGALIIAIALTCVTAQVRADVFKCDLDDLLVTINTNAKTLKLVDSDDPEVTFVTEDFRKEPGADFSFSVVGNAKIYLRDWRHEVVLHDGPAQFRGTTTDYGDEKVLTLSLHTWDDHTGEFGLLPKLTTTDCK